MSGISASTMTKSMYIDNYTRKSDKKVTDIQENFLRRFSRVTARAIIMIGPPSVTQTRPQISKMISKQAQVMSTDMVKLIMTKYTIFNIRVLALIDYEAKLTLRKPPTLMRRRRYLKDIIRRRKYLLKGMK